MKKELRRKMKELRADLLPEYREEAALCLLAQLQKMPEFEGSEILFCYASYGTELSTSAIVAAHGKVAYPKVFPDGEMRFYLGATLKPGFRGIPEPQGGEEVWPKSTDLMLLPGLAFDLQGQRLGYGGGYYDRYLAACQERPFCYGIGFEEQLVPSLPHESHDQPLDGLVLPKRIVKFY